ncbi:MAG: hypothetical protein R3F59_18740 [Myxococcota bacterium]
MKRLRCAAFAGLLSLSACFGGDPEPTGPATDGATEAPVDDADAGWLWAVAAHPDRFGERIGAAKPGWIALHGNRLSEAVTAFDADPVGRARAEAALGVLYADLSAVSGRVSQQLYTAWDARGTLPPGDEVPMVAALASWCSRGESAGTWAGRVSSGPDQAIAQALIQGRPPFDAESHGPFGKRMAIHQRVRSSGDPQALLSVAVQPVAVVEEADFTRQFWDPCVYRTLSDLWLDRAVRDAAAAGTTAPPTPGAIRTTDGGSWRKFDRITEGGDLGALLFSPWPTAADLSAELTTAESLGQVGATAPSLRALGVGTSTWPSDDPEHAKEEAALLDAGLDALQRRMSDLGEAEGVGVVNDLGLVHRFRQEWLVVRARKALASGQPRIALTLLELARDHAERTLGPRNSPSLFALTALARLQLGHTREALDALHVLRAAHPEVKGLVEVVGELAVLQGLDRSGDSKEE